jgi:hypothetical protein
MKKSYDIFKLIFFNILTLLFIFILADMYYLYKECNLPFLRAEYNIKNITKHPDAFLNYYFRRYYLFFFQHDTTQKKMNIYVNDINGHYRKIENKASKLAPILIFGCSYAYGDQLDDKQTFSAQLGKITSKPIYNRAISGRSVQHMLYQLQQEEFYKIIPKPEIIVYVYMRDHIRRLYKPCVYFGGGNRLYPDPDIFYKINNNKLELKKNKSLTTASPLFSLLSFYAYYTPSMSGFFYKNQEQFLLMHFKMAKEAAESHWGNVPFVILVINDDSIFRNIRNNLIQSNFTIIDASSQFNQSEFQMTDSHPTARAWEIFTPEIAKYLNNVVKNENKN